MNAVPNISLTALNTAVTENFDTLSNTAGTTTNSTLPNGWTLTESGGGARDNEWYAVDTGASNTGDTYSYGSSGSTDRALGGLQSGTLIPVFGAGYTNNTGTTITELLISYVGEQWRLGTAGRADRLDFQISFNATSLTDGTWTDVDALDFSSPNTSATVGALDGNASANRTSLSTTLSSLSIADGASFWIRWTDLNASGADDGLAIDNFSLTAMGLPGTVSLDDMASSPYSGTTGNDTIDASTRTLGIEIGGGEGADSITGGAGIDILLGGNGADTLVGGGSLDILVGGAGADTFTATSAAASTIAQPDFITDFETGVDTLNLAAADQGQAAIELLAGYANVYFGNDGSGNFSGLMAVFGPIAAGDITTSTGNINVFGSLFDETITTGAGADYINAGDGVDQITGGAGADRMLGGAGADTFFFGASDSLFAARDQIFDFQSGADILNLTAGDAGQVAIVYGAGYSQVYFGNTGDGNFASMVEVYGEAVQTTDIVTTDPSVFVFDF